ncbi:hypothetical protein FHG87_008763 [Trinorchestia longiramus]|nr:hypothetical protein FHG87_008763 [Trinorchestia longiramus]
MSPNGTETVASGGGCPLSALSQNPLLVHSYGGRPLPPKRVETMIDNDPSKSMRSMAAELRVDKRTIQRCVDEDLQGSEQCSLPCLQTLPCLAGGALLRPRNQAPMASQQPKFETN